MSRNTMKAIRLHEFGGPEVLQLDEITTPVLKSGEVLVRVHAAGINPPDWYLREGYKMLPPRMETTCSVARHSRHRCVRGCRGRRR